MTENNPSAPWQPPPDYVMTTSALEGITVYAPQSLQSTPREVEIYKCPNCGANTHYDVSVGGVACEYCGYRAPVQADQVGRSAEKSEFTVSTMAEAEQGWGVVRRVLHCDSCGAELAIEESALTTTCPFCLSNKVNVTAPRADQLRPRFLIPFSVKPQSCRDLTAQWLGKGWFHPSELSTTTVLARFMGIYLPFWTFGARISSTWKAEVGYERHVRYYDHGSKSWKTKTVIDWRWEKGQVNIKIEDLLVFGCSRVSHTILERLLPYQLNGLVAYTPEFLAGWQAQAFDISLPSAWGEGKSIMREKAKKTCYADIPSHHVRNFSMTADFSDETWRYVLLPVYVAAYKFENKVFQMMINGQTGMVAGQKPVAWWKVWLAILAILSPGLLAGLVGVITLFLGGIGVVVLPISLVLLIIGGIFAFRIYKDAMASEAV